MKKKKPTRKYVQQELPLDHLHQNLLRAEALRDEGMEQIAVNGSPWKTEALSRIATVRRVLQPPFTGEDIKVHLRALGLREPHHHNLWGPFIKDLMSYEILEPLHETRKTKIPCAHARMAALYQWKE